MFSVQIPKSPGIYGDATQVKEWTPVGPSYDDAESACEVAESLTAKRYGLADHPGRSATQPTRVVGPGGEKTFAPDRSRPRRSRRHAEQTPEAVQAAKAAAAKKAKASAKKK